MLESNFVGPAFPNHSRGQVPYRRAGRGLGSALAALREPLLGSREKSRAHGVTDASQARQTLAVSVVPGRLHWRPVRFPPSRSLAGQMPKPTIMEEPSPPRSRLTSSRMFAPRLPSGSISPVQDKSASACTRWSELPRRRTEPQLPSITGRPFGSFGEVVRMLTDPRWESSGRADVTASQAPWRTCRYRMHRKTIVVS